MTERNQCWVPYKEVEIQDMGAGLHRRILAYGDTLMCVENAFETGAVGTMHSHPHTQITYIVSGVFEFCIDGEYRTMQKGDSMFVPGGIAHGCTCMKSGSILDIYTPMRADFIPQE